jgi:hypothetical protein
MSRFSCSRLYLSEITETDMYVLCSTKICNSKELQGVVAKVLFAAVLASRRGHTLVARCGVFFLALAQHT